MIQARISESAANSVEELQGELARCRSIAANLGRPFLHYLVDMALAEAEDRWPEVGEPAPAPAIRNLARQLRELA